jgi:hypothetical protein
VNFKNAKKNMLKLLTFIFIAPLLTLATEQLPVSKPEPVIVARRLAGKKIIKSRSRQKSKSKSKSKPKSTSKPNAKILYNNVPMYAKPNKTSKVIAEVDEGLDIRVSRKMRNNYIYVRIISEGQKRIGWIHMENLQISPKILNKILSHNKTSKPTPPSQEDFDGMDPEEEEKVEAKTKKHMEKTLILPSKLNFVTWNFILNQELYSANSSGVNEEVSSSKFAIALNFLVGISDNTNFIFDIPYQISGNTKSTSTLTTASTKEKGFRDFSVGFKNRLLSQKSSIDLILEAVWKSGFMSSSIATVGSTGGAGSGSHDFKVSLTFGKNFKSWAPHLKVEGQKIGSSKKHAADDSYSQSYASTSEFTFEFGFELPQLRPLIIVDPYVSYTMRGKRSVKTITTVEVDSEIDSQKGLTVGMNLFLYKSQKTFVFNYNYQKIDNYNQLSSSISNMNQHNFSAGIRF